MLKWLIKKLPDRRNAVPSVVSGWRPPPMPHVATAQTYLPDAASAIQRAQQAWNSTQLDDALRSVKFLVDKVEQAHRTAKRRLDAERGVMADEKFSDAHYVPPEPPDTTVWGFATADIRQQDAKHSLRSKLDLSHMEYVEATVDALSNTELLKLISEAIEEKLAHEKANSATVHGPAAQHTAETGKGA